VTQEFKRAVKESSRAFGLELSAENIDRLTGYYEIVQEHNSLLHLVAPCPADEFAVRHILESLVLLEYLPQNCLFADVGPGAGLPSIPCLIVRSVLSAILVESKEKKVRYLETAISTLGLTGRATIINKQFEEVREKEFDVVTCRALDKFSDKLPRLLKWAGKRQCLFFGGPALGRSLKDLRVNFEERLLPLSEQRYLFIIR